ncbi:hypothetical protein D3C76_1351890 [compost metagenome]
MAMPDLIVLSRARGTRRQRVNGVVFFQLRWRFGVAATFGILQHHLIKSTSQSHQIDTILWTLWARNTGNYAIKINSNDR